MRYAHEITSSEISSKTMYDIVDKKPFNRVMCRLPEFKDAERIVEALNELQANEDRAASQPDEGCEVYSDDAI